MYDVNVIAFRSYPKSDIRRVVQGSGLFLAQTLERNAAEFSDSIL